jgi:cell division protein FtsW
VTARVSLGRVFAPVPLEFLLIASSALLLTGFGVVMVTSATTASALSEGKSPYNDGMQQAIFALLGVAVMFTASRLPVRFFHRIAWPLLALAVLVQLLVFTPLGFESGGNRNWINIGGFSAQPSELLKLALAIWVAAIVHRKRHLLKRMMHVYVPIVPVAGIAIVTVLAGSDLGTSMVLVLILLGTLFFAGVRLRFFVPLVVGGAAAVILLAVKSPNRMQRILSFVDPNCDYHDECYQPLHGIWGLASGGVLGVGLGNSTEKYSWLPAIGDDYIFSIVGEELGLIGCLVVLFLFGVLAVGAFRIIRRSDDLFVSVATGGIVVWILGQALINMGVVLRVFPVLGVPLPFMSAGGSSLVSVLAACGVLLAFSRTLPEPRGRAREARPATIRR